MFGRSAGIRSARPDIGPSRRRALRVTRYGRGMRCWSTLCASLFGVFSLLAGSACSTTSGNAASSSDGGDDAGDATTTFGADAANYCNPCYKACPCDQGADWPAPQACMTYYCGASGTWGPFNCLGSGCNDAGDAAAESSADDASEDSSSSAALDAGANGDATNDADTADAHGDVSFEAAAQDGPAD